MTAAAAAARSSAGSTVAVTLCSAARLDHLLPQRAALARLRPAVPHVVVWLDDEPAPALPELAEAHVLHLPSGPDGLRLAAGRNAGAERAIALGASLVVFLDADCVPGPELVGRYESAAAAHPDSLLCGPVTYLPEGHDGLDDASLAAATRPHAARPSPAPGDTVVAEHHEYPLFWSLSFALTASTWRRSGGFEPGYEGYGGEDTDFAFTARSLGLPLVWVGGAHAYHQWHPTTSPPWQHLDDILRNGRRFAERWGEWPMRGWLEAFREGGGVRAAEDGGWERVPA
jgi:N-acetylglucosaminyl-diphospho-decaprenol L-rhamnosyltransferase